MACLVEHQIAIREAVVVHVRRSKLLLVLVDLVQLGAHLPVRVASAHLSAENVSSLSGRSLGSLLIARHSAAWATWASPWSLSLDLRDHLHLVWILHHELAGVASVCSANTARALRTARSVHLVRHYLALRGNCWYLVVVFLYWR